MTPRELPDMHNGSKLQASLGAAAAAAAAAAAVGGAVVVKGRVPWAHLCLVRHACCAVCVNHVVLTSHSQRVHADMTAHAMHKTCGVASVGCERATGASG